MLSCILFVFTVSPRYNAPHYNADSVITRSVFAPEITAAVRQDCCYINEYPNVFIVIHHFG